jgi:hypothetical protein
MTDDWVVWVWLSLCLLSVLNTVISLQSGTRIATLFGGPLSGTQRILTSTGLIFISTGFLGAGHPGIRLPGVIPSALLITGLAFTVLSLLILVAIPLLMGESQHLRGTLKRLIDQEIAVGVQRDGEIKARREARRQARAARRQA